MSIGVKLEPTATTSPTPETDAKIKDYNGPLMTIGGVHFIPSDFARKLERELDEARRERDNALDQWDRLIGEHHKTGEALSTARAELAEARRDEARLDWIASRKSTELCYFTAAGWSLQKASGGDELHDKNIHDLRAAIDAARKNGGVL